MDSPESQDSPSQQTTPEEHNESMSLIVEEIDQSDEFSPDKAKSLGLFYTLYSQKQREDIFKEHPKAIVMGKFAEHLADAVELARGGDYSEVARFMRSEAENMRGNGYERESPEYKRMQKLREIAEILDKTQTS